MILAKVNKFTVTDSSKNYIHEITDKEFTRIATMFNKIKKDMNKLD